MSKAAGWPAVLRHGDIELRPIRRQDEAAWQALRAINAVWLAPWDATAPRASDRPPTFRAFVRSMLRDAKAGRVLPWMIWLNGELVGQLTVSSIARGSAWNGSIGYWISEHVAGRGIMPTAVAMAIDHCFQKVGLHRIEIVIRPENRPSLRVVEKLGLRYEGMRRAYLHIAGHWADHRSFAITAEEVPGGLLARFEASKESPSHRALGPLPVIHDARVVSGDYGISDKRSGAPGEAAGNA